MKVIQDDILSFENNLRKLLVISGKKNDDVISYLKAKIDKEKNINNVIHLETKLHEYQNKYDQMITFGEFQLFYLRDIMMYSNSAKITNFSSHSIGDKKKSALDIIGGLRNMAMHGKNPIEKIEDINIYSIESLRYFFTSLEVLRVLNHDLELKIHNNSDFQTSIRLDNQNKLKIIHEHHPKALTYFLSR